MESSPRTFQSIRLHVYTLGALAVGVGVMLFVLYYGLNQRVRAQVSDADDLHLTSSVLCARVRSDLAAIDRNFFLLRDLQFDPAIESQAREARIDELYRAISVSGSSLVRYVADLAILQRQFSESEFERTLNRLVEHSGALEAVLAERVDPGVYLAAGTRDLSIAAQQLGRMHLAAHDTAVEGIQAIRSENIVIFAAAAALALLLGLAASRRSLDDIRSMVAREQMNQELLRDSETRWKTILDTTADGIITIDEHGIVTSFNERAGKMFGYAPHEILGESVSILMAEPDKGNHDGYIRQYLETGEKRAIGFRREVTGLKKNGETFPIVLSITEMHVDGHRMFNGLVRDLTEEKETQEEIFKLHRALEESSNEIYIFDGESLKFSYVNRGAIRNLGYDPDELFEMTPLDLKPEFTETSFLDRVAPLLEGSRPEIDFQTVQKRKDGSLYPVDVRLSVVKWEEKMFLLAVIQDITERKHAEDERRKLEEQVQEAQKLESLGVLAGGIAHDFNNLLVSILGNADLAREELSPLSPALTSIKEIEVAAVRAAELCRQMLAYSGKGKFVIEITDLNELVEEMAHLLEVSISKKAIIKYNFANNLPSIEADATQMRQVVMNLITNASDAIGEKSGVISISTGAMDCDRNYLDEVLLSKELKEGLYVYLEVADTGSGMDDDTQRRLFEPFFSTKFTGRGLGLAATLGIIRGHEGAIKVYSELGKGTTMKFLIPASSARPDPSAQGSGKEASKSWRGEGAVLLVDDEETVLAVGKRLLEASGFSVFTARDGREALDVFKKHEEAIVLVLLDLTMPHMDGEETYRELRRLRHDVRVILSSGYNQQEVISRFSGKGLAGFIQKPYRLAELKEKIRGVLES